MVSNSQISYMDRRTAPTIFPLVDSSMPKRSYAQAALNYKTKSESVQCRMLVTPLGLCLRIL